MLQEYKKIHEAVADRIEGWREINKNDLIRSYEKYESNPYLKEGYVAAIMCRYWGAITRYYQKSMSSGITKEDCYEWLTHAVLYALEHKAWNRKFSSKKRVKSQTVDAEGNMVTNISWDKNNVHSNSIYLDPKGPDKCMNMCIASTRNIFYQAANNSKRSANYKEACRIEDAFSDDDEKSSVFVYADYTYDPGNSKIESLPYVLISDLLKKGDYKAALVIDGVINGDSFVTKRANGKAEQSFSAIRLSKHLRTIDKKYCTIFADLYDADINEVEQAAESIVQTPALYIPKLIRQTFEKVTPKLRDLREDYCM